MSNKSSADRPFSSDFGDRFFFQEPHRAQCLNLLLHLAPYSKEVLLLSGDLGVGKSALLRQLISKAPENCRVCYASANKVHNVPALLAVLQNALPTLHTVEGSDEVATAEEALRQIQAHGQRPVIIIDDAQNLSTQLANLFDQWIIRAAERGDFFTLILAGKTGFDELPSIKTLSRHGFHPLHLETLSPDETRQYVQYQLEKSGLPKDQFSPVELEIIGATANGIPGLINAEARKFMSEQPAHSARVVDNATGIDQAGPEPAVRVPLSRYLIPLAVLLIIAGSAAWWILNQDAPKPIPSDTPSTESISTATTRVEAPIPPSNGPAKEETPGIDMPTVPPESGGDDVEMAMHELPEDIAPLAGDLSPEQINALLEERIARGKQDRPPWEEQNDTPAADPAPEADSVSLQPVSETATGTNQAATPPASTRHTQTTVPPAVENAPESSIGIKNGDWLLTQDPTHYTLQLAAYGKLAEVQRAATKLGQQDKIAYFPLVRNGKRLYAVVYGIFLDESSARAAIGGLPKTLGTLNPIVKSLRSVQKDIGAAR